MGSLFSAPKVPTPPAPPPPSTYVDQVSGVEQVPVTNPDGSITYTTRALPLTPEQQAQKDQLSQIMNDSLAQIQTLSASDYQNDPDTQKILDQWRTVQQKTLDDTYAQRTQQEEQRLAERGLGDSSAADAVRRTRRLDQQDAEQNLDNEEGQIGSSVRSQNLQLQQQLYNLAASGINSSDAAAQAAAAKSFSSSISSDATRQASLLDYYEKTMPASGYSVFDSALQKGVGTSVAESIFDVPGSLLGSLFGG
jgi:hypothetical protein